MKLIKELNKLSEAVPKFNGEVKHDAELIYNGDFVQNELFAQAKAKYDSDHPDDMAEWMLDKIEDKYRNIYCTYHWPDEWTEVVDEVGEMILAGLT